MRIGAFSQTHFPKLETRPDKCETGTMRGSFPVVEVHSSDFIPSCRADIFQKVSVSCHSHEG
jgi:hypothetical protein